MYRTIRLLGAPVAATGVTGAYARENARRAPKRTAATAAALMVGVTLALEHDDLVKYANEVGLDIPRFEKDMADAATEDRIKADEKQADALGAKGTPTSFVNGYRLTASQVDAIETMLGVAAGTVSEPELALWITQNSKER